MVEKYTKEYFIETGRKGGTRTRIKYGKKYLRKIASKGGKVKKKSG